MQDPNQLDSDTLRLIADQPGRVKTNFMDRPGLRVIELSHHTRTCAWIPSLRLDGPRCGLPARFAVVDPVIGDGVPICLEHVGAAKAHIREKDGDPAAAFRAARDLRKKLAWNKRNKIG